MGKVISDTEIGKNTNFAPDQIFVAQALADTAATTSAEFLFPQTLGTCELKVVANGDVVTGVGETLVVTVVTSPTSGGTFDDTILTVTIPASTTISDGDDVARFVAPREISECYTKVVVTSDFDAQALKVDGIVIEV